MALPFQPSSSNALHPSLLSTLQQLLALPALELRPTLNQASTLVGEALDAEKVDVFLYQEGTDSLLALGTSQTDLGRRQHQLGLNLYPRANDGPVIRVFDTGAPYHTGRADLDPTQPRGVIEGLGIRSQIDVPLTVNGERRGVFEVASTAPDHFTESDEQFLEAVAMWIGLLTHRAELVQQVAAEARSQGLRQASEELAVLTRRHQDVAACVAEGLSNDEIAARLVITAGTVANHVQHILGRLGLRNRAALATWAVEHGLYRSDWA